MSLVRGSGDPVKITIRRAEPSDFEAFARVLADPSVYAGTLQTPFPSVEGWRKRLAEPSDDHFILVACVDGDIVGHGGLHRASPRPRRAHARELGVTVRADFQGKGVGARLMEALLGLADGWLDVTRVELNVFTDNARAIALYRRFGFEVEGTHRAFALRDGRLADVHSMARIRHKAHAGSPAHPQ